MAIENKEIRGISIKTIVWLVVCTVSIVSTVIGSYVALTALISKNQTATAETIALMVTRIALMEEKKYGDEKYSDLRMKSMELLISTVDLRVRELEKKP